MTGLRGGIYWGGCFVWDYFVMILVSLLVVIFFIAFQDKQRVYTEDFKILCMCGNFP
jgi:hypothetical protein